MLFDRLNYSMNSFVKAQSQAHIEFLSNLLEKEKQKKITKLLFEFMQKEILFAKKWN